MAHDPRSEIILQNAHGAFEVGVNPNWRVKIGRSQPMSLERDEEAMALDAMIRTADAVTNVAEIWDEVGKARPPAETPYHPSAVVNNWIRALIRQMRVPDFDKHIIQLGKGVGAILIFCGDVRSDEPVLEILRHHIAEDLSNAAECEQYATLFRNRFGSPTEEPTSEEVQGTASIAVTAEMPRITAEQITYGLLIQLPGFVADYGVVARQAGRKNARDEEVVVDVLLKLAEAGYYKRSKSNPGRFRRTEKVYES